MLPGTLPGGHTIESLEHFDYSEERLEYFAEQLSEIRPDIVCLQESHTANDNSRSTAADLAEMLDFSHLLNTPASPSHIKPNYQLSTAILSHLPFISTESVFFPDPGFERTFPNGQKIVTHRKNMQIIQVGNIHIANNQMLPLPIFGYDYDDGKKGEQLAHQINQVMASILKTPLVWCGDFNFNHPRKVYPIIQELQLEDALPDIVTRPNEKQQKLTPDHILYSPDFTVQESDVIQTKTDHYLCYARFNY